MKPLLFSLLAIAALSAAPADEGAGETVGESADDSSL